MNITAPRLQAVLGSLLIRANEVVTVDQLVDSVWEHDIPADPTNQIAVCVSVLRRKLRQLGAGENIIVTQSPGYRFDAGEVFLDTAMALRQRSAAEKHIASGNLEPALACLKQALSLWRGSLLSGTDRRAWLAERHRWEEEYISLRVLCSEVQLSLELHSDVIAELSAFIRRYPLLEQPRAVLMTALSRTGRQADALQVYRDTHALLREELGVRPGSELRRLHEQILKGAVPSPPVGSPPRSRSSADRQGRVPVDPRGQEPALTGTPARSSKGPCLLPGDIADFTGREEETDSIRSALVPTPASVPVALLVGPGGTGKTALAVHVAHQLRAEFPDGQLYINLRGMGAAPVSPEEALARFLRELGLSGPVPETLDERAESYRSLLADRNVLIVLDDAGVPGQVLPLLPGTGSCAVIVTSRARLTTIPSARVLELDVFQKEQALTLLSRLVGHQRVAEESEVADQLVEYCGRLPLAVRILGAKLMSKPHWSLRKAASRLADERGRLDELAHEHLEVRASLGLSHQGISPAARQLFRRLALVAVSDFAEWVCSPLMELSCAEAEVLLEELLDARLLDIISPEGTGDPRYRIHDLVRLYAWEQALETEPTEERKAALARLGMTALALADRAHRAVCGGDFTVVHHCTQRPAIPADLLERVGDDPLTWYEADRSFVSALCQLLAEQGNDELAWDLAATSRCQFSLRFHFDDWRTTHDVALRVARLHGNERGAAAMLLGLGDLHLTKRDLGRAVPLLEESQRLFRKVGDDYGHALALRKAAYADRVRGRFDQALTRWQECLPILREDEDAEAQAQVLRWTGQTLLEKGKPDEAEAFLRRARDVVRGFHGRSIAQVRMSLGELHLSRRELDRAAEEFSWGLEATSRSGDLSGHCYALWGLGWIDLLREHLSDAEERLGRARDLARRIHDPLLESDVVHALASARRIAEDLEGATALLKEGIAMCRDMDAAARLQRFTHELAEISATSDSGSVVR
ncbi:AfsR/SARP family transcriptional regulator [Streptomyces sp. 4N509B]|uniref:AfsR/SARP family transcriptional regulator n=1 Tax=Streptomyces sp. 4N509B TaxID=3457413 RepID=UPI003FCF5BD7